MPAVRRPYSAGKAPVISCIESTKRVLRSCPKKLTPSGMMTPSMRYCTFRCSLRTWIPPLAALSWSTPGICRMASLIGVFDAEGQVLDRVLGQRVGRGADPRLDALAGLCQTLGDDRHLLDAARRRRGGGRRRCGSGRGARAGRRGAESEFGRGGLSGRDGDRGGPVADPLLGPLDRVIARADAGKAVSAVRPARRVRHDAAGRRPQPQPHPGQRLALCVLGDACDRPAGCSCRRRPGRGGSLCRGWGERCGAEDQHGHAAPTPTVRGGHETPRMKQEPPRRRGERIPPDGPPGPVAGGGRSRFRPEVARVPRTLAWVAAPPGCGGADAPAMPWRSVRRAPQTRRARR